MKIGRTRGKRAQRRRLEFSEVVPRASDVATPRIGQLPLFSGGSIAYRVQRQIRRPRFCRGGADIEERVVDVRSVISRAVAVPAAAVVSRVLVIEQLLASGDLRTRRNRRILPGIKQVESALGLGHPREF